MMLFSEYIQSLSIFWGVPTAGTLMVIAPFVLIFWLGWKLFKTFVLNRQWLFLVIGGMCVYAGAESLWAEGQYILSLIFAIPLIMVGREIYFRLLEGVE